MYLQSARIRLVAANIGLVRKLAHDYKHWDQVSFQDLVQAGLWGLDRGLTRYDPTRGAKLSTAVYWYIRDAIFKTCRLESQQIHIPLTTQEQMGKLRTVIERHQQQHPGQQPSLEQLAQGTGLGKSALKRVMQVSALSELSIDALTGSGNGRGGQDDSDDNRDSVLDRLAASDADAAAAQAQSAQLLQLDLEHLLTLLPDPMGAVVRERYGLLDGHAKTFEEVSLHSPDLLFENLACLLLEYTCIAASVAWCCLWLAFVAILCGGAAPVCEVCVSQGHCVWCSASSEGQCRPTTVFDITVF